ncbi:MAG: hypothetical protein ACI9N9_000131 [Enterobacterales bacterium]|jgi:hypothetical protein
MMNHDFENIKNIEDPQHYFQKNKIFTFSLSISLILHIFLLLIILYSNRPCIQCKDHSQDNIKVRQTIKTYLLKQPPLEIIPEEEIDTIVSSQSETIIKSVIAELKPKSKQKTITKKQTQATAKPLQGKLNFTALRNSINNVIEQDNQTIREAIFEDCETVKNNSGALDCISNIERLGHNKNDPYHLSTIFKSLDKNPDNKKKERMLAKLKLNENYISAALDNKQLPTTMREQFKEEIAYIRGEIHYQDCDGKPNSGTCAGEVDLGKIGQLLGLLFSK